MKKLRFAAFVLTLLTLLCSCSKGGAVSSGGEYMFVTGKSGGTYNSLGTSMAAVWDKYSGGKTTVISTTGSFDNIDMLTKGDADIGLVQSDILYYALNGKEMYENSKKSGLSVIANLYTEAVQLVVNAESDIQTINGLVGKTVAVGKYGTATEAAARQILESSGITYDMITVKYQTFSEASAGLAAGTVDAIFAVSAMPSSNIHEYAETRAIRFIPITSSTKLKRACPFFSDGIILSEIYGTENSVSTVCIDVLLICRSDLSADGVSGITSALFGNLDELASAHILGSLINSDTASSTRIGTMHPAAAKYYSDLLNADAE
ncbi:MAG: TAXI family TRAP transporter solute-binding subunit [Oscillospiraceae bacterium]